MGGQETSSLTFPSAIMSVLKGCEMRQTRVVLEDENGQVVQLRENFALSNVAGPLPALINFLEEVGRLKVTMAVCV